MNTGRKMKTRETKYSEGKKPGIGAERCSTLKFTATINIRTKGDAIYEISEHREIETLPLFELMLKIHNNSVLNSQKTVPAYHTNKTCQYCIQK
jgi:hypothetical protein